MQKSLVCMWLKQNNEINKWGSGTGYDLYGKEERKGKKKIKKEKEVCWIASMIVWLFLGRWVLKFVKKKN